MGQRLARLWRNHRITRWVSLIIIALSVGGVALYPKSVGGGFCACSGDWNYKTDSLAVCDKPVFDVFLKTFPIDDMHCLKPGLHSWHQDCLGTEGRSTILTGVGIGYFNFCMGIPLGQPQCLGMPITGTVSETYIPLPCDYPYSDLFIREACGEQESVILEKVTIDCVKIRQGRSASP